jgi:hypothetical protein
MCAGNHYSISQTNFIGMAMMQDHHHNGNRSSLPLQFNEGYTLA